jgi:hypothetical protein
MHLPSTCTTPWPTKEQPYCLIYPVHARVYSWCLVNIVMNFRISNKAANSFTSCQTVNPFTRNLLNQVISPRTPHACSSRKGIVGIVSRLRTEQLRKRGSCPSRGKEKSAQVDFADHPPLAYSKGIGADIRR